MGSTPLISWKNCTVKNYAMRHASVDALQHCQQLLKFSDAAPRAALG